MQFLDPSNDHNTHAPLSIQNMLARAKFTDSDEKLVTKGLAEIRRILQLIPRLKPGRDGQYGKLHEEVDAELEKLFENPTVEQVEACHDAILRERDAAVSFDQIDLHLNRALNREIEAFRPVAERLINQVRDDVISDGAKLRKVLQAGDKIFGEGLEIPHFEARLKKSIEMLDGELAAVKKEGSALHWLSSNGFCSNPYHE